MPALTQHPVWTAGVAVIAALVAIVLLWNWNWLNPLVAAAMSRSLGRPVTLARLDLRDLWSGNPTVELDDVTIGNPRDFPGDRQLGHVEQLAFRINAAVLLKSRGGQVIVDDVRIVHPQGDLRAGPKGERNWSFDFGRGGGSGTSLSIGSLAITDGEFRINDPKLKADLIVKVATEEAKHGGEARLVISAHGTYAGQPFKGKFTGGSILSLRDPQKPYPVDLVATDGGTRVALKGTVTDAAKLAGANLQMELAGQDLAQLYPILGIPLAETPPYRLRGHFEYGGNHIKLSDFAGVVGQSDLAGNFDVDRGHERPLITAEVTSHKVRLTDLGGFLGTTPDRPGTPNQAPEHKAQEAQRESSPSLLPDEPFNFEKLHAADFRVHYKGERIEADWAPLDNFEVNLDIDNGRVTLQPLNFGIGQGSIASTILLDSQRKPIHAEASVDFRQVDFQRLMQATKQFEGMGVVGGRAELTGDGNSPAAMLANGNGDLKLFMNDGIVSALLVNLAGLDLGKSLMSALGLPDKTRLRCMIGDFGLQQGVLQTRALVFDTDEANVIGKGTIDLRNNTIDYEVSQDPKHFSVLALHAPIRVTGPLKNPTITPDPRQLGMKAVTAVVTALLATVQLGLGKDNNCNALVHSAEQAAQAPPDLPPAPPHAAEGSKPSTIPRQKTR